MAKQVGALGLPRDLYYVYSVLRPTWMQNMRPGQFAIISRRGNIGVGVFPRVGWHKQEGEDILRKVRLKVSFEEAPMEARYRGRYRTIGDVEHTEILRPYVEEGLGTGRIAERLGRSTKNIHDHLLKHDRAVDRLSYCPLCRRAKSPHESVKARREIS